VRACTTERPHRSPGLRHRRDHVADRSSHLPRPGLHPSPSRNGAERLWAAHPAELHHGPGAGQSRRLLAEDFAAWPQGSRRPKRAKVKGFTAKLGEPVIFYGAPPACRSRIPQNPACQSGRAGLGLRPVGSHPADRPLFFLLLLALVWQVSLRTWQVCLRKGERRGWGMPPDLVPTVDPLKNHHWVNVAQSSLITSL
jgi:hypothetical protein